MTTINIYIFFINKLFNPILSENKSCLLQNVCDISVSLFSNLCNLTSGDFFSEEEEVQSARAVKISISVLCGVGLLSFGAALHLVTMYVIEFKSSLNLPCPLKTILFD